MDSTISIRERLESELKEKLEPFVEECYRRGYPVENLRVHESVPGVHDMFFIEVDVNWSKTWIKAIDILYPILRETTPKNVHKLIYGISPELQPMPLGKKTKRKKKILAAG